MPVHWSGRPCEMDKINAISAQISFSQLHWVIPKSVNAKSILNKFSLIQNVKIARKRFHSARNVMQKEIVINVQTLFKIRLLVVSVKRII